ncbi:MAG: lipoate--protein ligase family protein [Epsilonproteobacteria bacterium]|nr:lipoate--protein ligase family protein [Campylobacterota bacterium]
MARELALKWRFVDSPRLGAKENMAIDESLLSKCQDEPIFRVYSWEENSFTIGRFQKIEDIKDWQRYGKNWAKRVTGGGLLLHGFDLSYSIILPTKLLGKKSVKQSYEYLCEFLLNFYKKLGLETNWAKDIFANSLSHSSFCQEGFEPYDIIIDGKKIGGNAQKRTKKLILQHGSIPLKTDSREHAGHSLEELNISISLTEAKQLLKESFCKTYNIQG